MVRLHELPQDVLKKLLSAYLKRCDGTPVVWRLVCKELRDIAADEPKHSSLQRVGVSIGLVRMLDSWIQCAYARMKLKRIPELSFPVLVRHSDLLDAVARHDNAAVFQAVLHEAKEWRPRLEMFSQCMYGRTRARSLCCVAAGAGALGTLMLLADAGFPLGAEACEHAVRNGHAGVVKWFLALEQMRAEGMLWWQFAHPVTGENRAALHLQNQVHPMDHNAHLHLLKCAVKHGHLPVVELLLPKCLDLLVDEHVYECLVTWSAEYGWLEILQRAAAAMGDGFLDCAEDVCFEAAYGGHVPMLRWLVPQFPEHLENLQDTAFQFNVHNNLELVTFLVEETNMRLTVESMFLAIGAYTTDHGFQTMDYLYSKQCPMARSGSAMCSYADEYQCASRQLGCRARKVMQWLYDHNYPVPVQRGAECMREALRADNVDVVKHLVAFGVDFDARWYGSADYHTDERAGVLRHSWEPSAVVAWARANGHDIPTCPASPLDRSVA